MMRAVVFSPEGVPESATLTQPSPGPGEVLVKMRVMGLCHSDLYPGRGSFLPRVIGHDGIGHVADCGDGTDPGLEGADVVIDPEVCCTRSAEPRVLCEQCRSGETHRCVDGSVMGEDTPGIAAEYVAVPAARAVPTGRITEAAGTIIGPIATALHLEESIENVVGPALVIGGGPMGTIIAAVLRNRGNTVTIVEPEPFRRDRAAALSGAMGVSPDAVSGPGAERLVVLVSDHPEAAALAARASRPGGTVATFRGTASPPWGAVAEKELTVMSVHGRRGLHPLAVHMAQTSLRDLGDIVTHRYPAARAAEATTHTVHRPDLVHRTLVDLREW